jgi:hypothetical protein
MVGWYRRHYPGVKETTVAAHIYAATANAVNRAENHPVDYGLYVRAVGSPVTAPPGRRQDGADLRAPSYVIAAYVAAVIA